MADSTNIPPSSSELSKRNVRGPTKMKKITKVLKSGVKIKVDFNPETGRCYGPNAAEFKSYAAYLARSRCSILIDEWPQVDENTKDAIWVDLQKHFVIPESDDPKNDPLKKKWMVFLGARWRGFKAQLTSEYITYPNPERCPPYVRYAFIKEHTWKRFLESRNTDAFKVISQKGRDCVTNNIYRHTLSRGGYELLEDKMINEKRKILEASGDYTLSGDLNLSPPPRHETWKRARQKKGGEYTSEATKVVFEKIDSLVEETANGMFVPQGRDDILTKAIGTSEHGGRVRGVSQGYTLSNYFGRSSRPTQTKYFSEHLSQLQTNLERQMKEKFDAEFGQKMAVERELMQQTFMEKLKTMGFSQTLQTNEEIEKSPEKVVNHGSTKGSCTAAQENYKEDSTVDNVQKLLCMLLRNQEDIHIRLEHEPNVERF